jgi:hypothetical protein
MLSELPMAKRLPMNDSRRAVKTELQPVSHRPLSAGTVVFRQILLWLASVSVGLRSLAEAAEALDLGQFRGGCQGRRKTRPAGRSKIRPLSMSGGFDLFRSAGVAGAEACAAVLWRRV